MGIMLIDSLPPAIRMCAPPARMRSAAIAMACRPELQKRLMVTPVVVTGRPARRAAHARHVAAGFAFGHRAAENHVFDIVLGTCGYFSSRARMTVAARSSGRVLRSAPRGLFRRRYGGNRR